MECAMYKMFPIKNERYGWLFFDGSESWENGHKP